MWPAPCLHLVSFAVRTVRPIKIEPYHYTRTRRHLIQIELLECAVRDDRIIVALIAITYTAMIANAK